jgi:hypothetical protein
LRFAHREIQRTKNWRAMEHRVTDIVYPGTADFGVGVAVAPTVGAYKMANALWLVTENGLQFVRPATEDEVNRLRRAHIESRGSVDLTAAHLQRWYERELKVVLLLPPALDTDIEVDIWRYLPFYDDIDVGGEGQPETVEDATDWFSDNLPEALCWGAAYYLSRFSRDLKAEAAHYLEVYKGLCGEAWQSDVVSRQAGAAGGTQPPRVNPVTGGPK